MRTAKFHLTDEDKTKQLATQLAHCLHSPVILTFSGDIGAGKTAFIRSLLQARGITSAIKSPTFSLVESYGTEPLPIHHFDLYRIEDEEELEFIGFRDYFDERAILCIEWPERASATIIQEDLRFSLSMGNTATERELTIIALSATGDQLLLCLEGKK